MLPLLADAVTWNSPEWWFDRLGTFGLCILGGIFLVRYFGPPIIDAFRAQVDLCAHLKGHSDRVGGQLDRIETQGGKILDHVTEFKYRQPPPQATA